MLLIDVIRTGEFLMGTCEEFNVPVAICCLPALSPCCPGPCCCFLLPLPRWGAEGGQEQAAEAWALPHLLWEIQTPDIWVTSNFFTIGCYYPCFSGWMNRHNFIKLVICYISCTTWKAISETNDCKALTIAGVNSPCCILSCWGQRHRHQAGRDDRAWVTCSSCPRWRESTST